MSFAPVILAIGLCDDTGVAGTSGVCGDWEALEAVPPGTGRTFRKLFGRPDSTFRRIDRMSRAAVLATQAAGVGAIVPEDLRDETAVVFETERGALDADLRFVRSLEQGIVEGPLFPYSLPSTCIGEVALRHGFRGASLCMSIEAGQRGVAYEEAGRLLAHGEARFVLVGSIEVLLEPSEHVTRSLRAVMALVAAPREGGAPVAAWPGGSEDPFGELAGVVRSESG